MRDNAPHCFSIGRCSSDMDDEIVSCFTLWDHYVERMYSYRLSCNDCWPARSKRCEHSHTIYWCTMSVWSRHLPRLSPRHQLAFRTRCTACQRTMWSRWCSSSLLRARSLFIRRLRAVSGSPRNKSNTRPASRPKSSQTRRTTVDDVCEKKSHHSLSTATDRHSNACARSHVL